jgi:ABC-type transporter Mla subunit MlaD
MKYERADLMVGMAVIGGIIVSLSAAIWMVGAQRQDTYPVYARFTDITGLGEQASVLLRGFEIGRVSQVTPLVEQDGTLAFRVRMDVLWSLAGSDPRALPEGTTALLKPPPIIGAGYIELILPDEPGRPPLVPGASIPGFSEPPLAQQAAQMTGGMVFEISHALQDARRLMDSLALATAAVHRLLATTTDALPVAAGALDTRLASADQLMQELQQDARILTPALLASVDSAVALMSDARKVLVETGFTLEQAGPELQRVLANLESTTLMLDYFTRQVAQRPTRMVSGVRLPSLDSLRSAAAAARRH